MSEDFRDQVGEMFEQARIAMNVDAEPFIADPDKLFTVRKIAAVFDVPVELIDPERSPTLKSTRRQRLRWCWLDCRDRCLLAWEALRGRHDCGEWS